jgi:hypothetical protein
MRLVGRLTVGSSIATLLVIGFVTIAGGSPTGAAPPANPGYWLAGADGGVFSFGAAFFGSGSAAGQIACGFSPQPPSTLNSALGCVGIASDPDGQGYWLLNVYRSATAYGSAALNSSNCTSLNGATGSWVGMAVLQDGHGFWLVSSNGGVMGCGSISPPIGGTQNLTLRAQIVGMAATPDRGGYWLVAADGGIFSFGDAAYYGSMGGKTLNAPIVGMAASADGKGYWLAAADGGIFAFGDAPFEGSTGGVHLNAPIVGMAVNPSGPGYWLAGVDGGVFALGGAPYRGSMAGYPLSGSIVGIAASP